MLRADHRRLWTRAAIAWFLASAALLVWPLFPWLGDAIEPRVLGWPRSLVYVIAVIVANSIALALLYARRVIDDEEIEGD
ncbi:MAG: hypothetical protein IPK80_16515 [Nannocystis sp.]|nr:hypothetical protein [Nannocystis sp.]